VSHRRLAYAALGASLVLLLGVYVRGRLQRSNQPAPAAPPSEASALQQLSHEGLLRRASSFVTERAAEMARFVVYVPQSDASGVRWRADTVLSAGLHRLIEVSSAAASDSATPVVRQLRDSIGSDWLLVVGRSRRGAVLSLAGAAGGIVRARCDSRDVDELLLNVPLGDHLAGAGVFDIDGGLVGLVVRCGHRLAAISVQQIPALLAQRDSLAIRADVLGASLAPLDSVARGYFGTDSGAVVSAVRLGSVAQRIGLRPGDVLLSIDDAPIVSVADASRALASRPDTTHRARRLRGRDRSVLLVPAPDSAGAALVGQRTGTIGLDLTPEPSTRGVAIVGVQPGSVAQLAGIRPGDRLTRIGSTDVTSRVTAERMLARIPPGPVFIAFERDSVEYGALVRR
jgi:hypothetical protein